MEWYYANNNRREGPVSEEEFARLVGAGIIVSTTLVWKMGMPNWRPYAEVPPVAVPPPPLPGTVPPVMDSNVAPVAPTIGSTATILRGAKSGLNYAGFGPRFLAALIDWVIMLVAKSLVDFGAKTSNIDFMAVASGNYSEMFPVIEQMSRVAAIGGLISLAYYWFFLKRFGATPGKMALGLRVVRADGGPLGHGRIMGRFFAEIISKYFTFGLGYLTCLADDEKRTLHDFIAGTRVVKKQ
jgi:uncharacterized RDD family membrane protein YckC